MQSRSDFKDISARQQQADAIVQWFRELRAPGAGGSLIVGTPLVILGGFNAYPADPARHIETLMTRNTGDTPRFGPSVAMDWDGSALADAAPVHNGIGPASHTFGDGQGEYPPAALDRILYSDSRLAQIRAFILNTTTLDPISLRQFGLRVNDVCLDARPVASITSP